MSLRDQWANFRKRRATKYLKTHQDLAADVLRSDPDLGVLAINHAYNSVYGSPLLPGPTESMEAATRGAPGRTTIPWPTITQFGMGGRTVTGASLPKATPLNLRRFSEYPPSRRAINAICNPILDLPWCIEPIQPMFEETMRPDNYPDDLKQRIITATRCLNMPNDDVSWRMMLEMVLEDVAVGGYGAIEIQPARDPERPVWMWPVDGQSIRINPDWSIREKGVHRYVQSLGFVGYSIGVDEPIKLRDDELIYLKLNPRTNTPFGLGYLETAFGTVNAFLGAFGWAERRASNATPQYLIFLGNNATMDQVQMWQAYWETMIEGAGKAPIIGGGSQPSVQQLSPGGDDLLFLKWQEFLLRVIAMAFGLSPQKLGVERDVNRSTATTQAMADWETIAPVANTVQDYLTHCFLWKTLGYRDLRFKWQIDHLDELSKAEMLRARWEMDSITADEIRAIYDDEPLPDGRGQHTKTEKEAQGKVASMSPLEEFGGPPLEEDGEEASALEAQRELWVEQQLEVMQHRNGHG